MIQALLPTYRIFAPVRKKGAGRFTDVDVIIYEEIKDAEDIELDAKSDYASKEFLTPLSETLLYFTEKEVKEADFEEKPVLIFGRSCDSNAVEKKEHIGYIVDRTGFEEFKKWIFEGVELGPKAEVNQRLYWGGKHYDKYGG